MSCCAPSCSGHHPGYTEGELVTLSTNSASPTLIRFGARRVDHSRSRGSSRPLPLPQRAMLSHVLLEGTEPVVEVGPTSVTWWLTADPEGCVVLTDQTTSTWVPSTEGNAAGGVAARLDQVWVQGLHADELFLWVYTDAGLQVRPRLTWYTLSDRDLTRDHLALLQEQV